MSSVRLADFLLRFFCVSLDSESNLDAMLKDAKVLFIVGKFVAIIDIPSVTLLTN